MEVGIVHEGRDKLCCRKLQASCCIAGVLIGELQGEAVELLRDAACGYVAVQVFLDFGPSCSLLEQSYLKKGTLR